MAGATVTGTEDEDDVKSVIKAVDYWTKVFISQTIFTAYFDECVCVYHNIIGRAPIDSNNAIRLRLCRNWRANRPRSSNLRGDT